VRIPRHPSGQVHFLGLGCACCFHTFAPFYSRNLCHSTLTLMTCASFAVLRLRDLFRGVSLKLKCVRAKIGQWQSAAGSEMFKPGRGGVFFAIFFRFAEPWIVRFPWLQERCPPTQKAMVGRLEAKVKPLSTSVTVENRPVVPLYLDRAKTFSPKSTCLYLKTGQWQSSACFASLASSLRHAPLRKLMNLYHMPRMST